jgi:hypothetical protein
MEHYTQLYVSEDKDDVKKKIADFEELFDNCIADGFISLDSGQTIGGVDVTAATKDSLKSVLFQLADEGNFADSSHDEKYRDKLKKALKDKKTLISVEITRAIEICPNEASQWTYIYDMFPEAVVVDDPSGEEISFARDLVEKYRKIQIVDIKNPEASDEETSAPASKDAHYVDQVFQVLESIQQNHEAVYAFKEFLSRATEAQKKFLENLLRRKIQTDTESRTLLAMDQAGFTRFAVQLQNELSALL